MLRRIIHIAVAVLIAGAMIQPAYVQADEAAPSAPKQALIITEIQTGTPASAAEEFVEIYNPAPAAVDLTGWRLQFANSSALDWQTLHRNIPLSGHLGPGEYMTVASKYSGGGQSTSYLEATATAWFNAGIAAGAGHARLVYDVYQPGPGAACTIAEAVADEVEWSAPANGQPAKPSLDGRSVFVTPAAVGIPTVSSLQRMKRLDGAYSDTGNDSVDFSLASPTPGAVSAQTTVATKGEPTALVAGTCPAGPTVPGPSGSSPAPPSPPTAGKPTPVVPPADAGLLAPQISELLPNPAAPATDADGEYVELYNPNDAVFDLTGFMLKTGLGGSYSYTFPAGTSLPARSFVSFLSKDTHLALSNTSGKAALLDPFGTVIAASEPYSKAAAGQAWIFAGNTWRWTTQPTPQAANIISAPAQGEQQEAFPKAASAKATKTAAVKAAKTTKTPKATVAKISKKSSAAAAEPAPKAIATAAAPQHNPLHPGVLAGAAILAVLYGAYEYRHDVANKINQLRANRAARRASGPGA